MRCASRRCGAVRPTRPSRTCRRPWSSRCRSKPGRRSRRCWRRNADLAATLTADGRHRLAQDADPGRRSRRRGRAVRALSGHHDTWYYGTMDNGGANATMMEVARLCALASRRLAARPARRVLVRPLARPLLVLGLVRRDALGGAGAPRAGARQRRLDRRQGQHDRRRHDRVRGAARGRARGDRAAGRQEFTNRRMGRAGDQSFWGIGVPVDLRQHERAARDRRGERVGGGVRRRQSPRRRHRLVVAHPVRHARQDGRADSGARHAHLSAGGVASADRRGAAVRLCGARAPISPTSCAACRAPPASASTCRCSPRAPTRCGPRRSSSTVPSRRASMRAGPRSRTRRSQAVAHALVPVDYSTGDRFGQDPALGQQAYPALQPLRGLASASARLGSGAVPRGRHAPCAQSGRVALREALAAIDHGLARLRA